MLLLTILLYAYYILTMIFPHNELIESSERIYPQVTMVIICAYLFYFTIKNINKILKTPILRSFIPLLFLLAVYIFYPSFNPQGENVVYPNALWYIKSVVAIPFMFYVYVELEKDDKKNLKYLYLIYLIQIVYAFYCLISDRLLSLAGSEEMFDSNAGFILVSLLPMTLLIPIRRLRLYMAAILTLACMYSGQRSAALAAIFFLIFSFPSLRMSVKTIDVVIFSLAFLFLGIPILQDSIDNILMRNTYDIEHGSFGSGRSIFWKIVWDGIWDGSPMQILFGHGSCTVAYLIKEKYGMAISSHNGWLDYLYMYGILGLFLYIKPLWAIFRNNRAISRALPSYKNFVIAMLILFLVKCTTSHGNWEIHMMPFAMSIAFIVHKYEKTFTEKAI